MLVDRAKLAAIYISFSTLFNEALQTAEAIWPKLASLAPSTSSQNDYKWLGTFPMLREWVAERYVKSLKGLGYSIVNKDYEATVEVDKNDINDDQVGVYRPAVQALGANAAVHPDKLLFELLVAGFGVGGECYDGQFFFDTDHPVAGASVSNYGGGAGNPWFLLDTSKFIMPFIYQEREKPNFVAIEDPKSESVFQRRMFQYGVDYRGAVGYALWQLAYGSKDTLSAANFEAAFEAMMGFKNDEGVPLGIKPNLLVVGPGNRKAALEILVAERLANGETNVNQGSAEILLSSWLV